MPFYPVQLSQVLAQINQTTPVEVENEDGQAEWFLLESADLEDSELYDILDRNWPRIVGVQGGSFALIHCRNEPNSGVWLHYFTTKQYAPGCHEVATW
jgi:hypothetical protein